MEINPPLWGGEKTNKKTYSHNRVAEYKSCETESVQGIGW
jgi:hypothetical protein